MTADEVRVELVADGVDAGEAGSPGRRSCAGNYSLDVNNVTRVHEELPPPGAGGTEDSWRWDP